MCKGQFIEVRPILLRSDFKRILGELYVMVSNDDKRIIKHYAKKYNLSLVLLFGSSLNNPNAKDIDIGIKGIKSELFFNFYWDIYSRLSKPVDVINLNKKNLFNRLIEKDGIVIYGESN